MENTFLHFLNISITAGWIVLAVVLLRLLLKKAPKWISCLLWAVVGLRLILPFSVESIFSLIPTASTVDPDIVYQSAPTVNTGFDAVNSVVNPIVSSAFAPDPVTSVNPMQILLYILSRVWIIGIALMILYTLISYLRLRVRISDAVKYEGNIYQSEKVSSPFILGILRPRIYIPYSISNDDIAHVTAHERAHLSRRDHLIKPVSFILLALYWFNPLMWVAYILLCRDIELACDEKVIKKMATEDRQSYSKALLDLSIKRMSIAACPLAFGEVGVKARVKSVMNYKKPAFWIIIIAIIVCIVVSVCFLTDPLSDKESDTISLSENEINMSLVENASYFELIYSENRVTVVTENEVAYIKEKISQLEISKGDSKDRSEDRPANYVLICYDDNGYYTMLNFDHGCSRVWQNNFVKPTLSYKIKNTDIVREVFTHKYTDPALIQYENIESAILEHNKDAYLKGDAGVAVYRELLTEGSDGKMIVYLQTLYGEYSLNDEKETEMISGGASTVRLTFEKNKGSFICTDYYERKKGNEDKFPKAVFDALDKVDMNELQAELDKKAEQMLTGIGYHYSDKNTFRGASLTLWGRDNFQFSYSLLSSHLCMGKYTKEDGKLILREDGNDNVYTFIINDKDTDSLIFDAKNSTELPKYKYGTYAEPEVCVPDGAVFNATYYLYDDIYDITEDNTETDNDEKTIINIPFSENDQEFAFSSGASAWATYLKLNNDGSFVGSYHDAEMGAVGEEYPHGCYYTCDFSGSFKNIEKINEYSYKMTLDNITTKHTPGEEWIENGVKYVATGPYGLEGGSEFILYLPETPATETPLGFLIWWPMRYGQIDDYGQVNDPTIKLSCYGICNVATTQGFFTY